MINFEKLDTFPGNSSEFLRSEDAGAVKGFDIHVSLKVTAPDLARLVSGQEAVTPASLHVEGCGTRALLKTDVRPEAQGHPYLTDLGFEIENGSSLEIFVRAPAKNEEQKFFCYHLRYRSNGQPWVMNGVKALRDAPGFDSWHDTSTLYFEAGPAREDGNPRLVRERGLLRVPVDRLLQVQLPSLDIIGTDDPARKSWALFPDYAHQDLWWSTDSPEKILSGR